MYCKHCGNQIPDTSTFCPHCANPVSLPRSSKALAGFIVSLCGIISLAIPCGIVGLILSISGKKDIEAGKFSGSALATAGITVSIIDIVVGCLFIAVSIISAM